MSVDPLESPVFITGVQRSGTTLLRTMLTSHPDIWVAYECGAYKKLGEEFVSKFHRSRIEEFVDSAFRVKRFEYWEVDRDQAVSMIAAIPHEQIDFRTALDALARSTLARFKPRASKFGYKNPHGIYHVDYIWKLYPKAYVINVVRDPRGILASEKSRRSRKNLYRPASSIRTVTIRFNRMFKHHLKLQTDPRYLMVRYEDLIKKTGSTLAEIMKFLGLEFHNEMLQYFEYAKQNNLTPDAEMALHRLTIKQPDPSRLTAYREALLPWEQANIEMGCQSSMFQLLGATSEIASSKRIIHATRMALSLPVEKLKGNPAKRY